ncbi:MAG: tRNA 2-thiouridine(34) synthase MnmA [Isosphaeraceae bacterium]
MSKRVVVAMSGGVDSSVAACLLKDQGYEVIGLFMRTGSHENEDRHTRTCCSTTDAVDARRVADQLNVPFYVLDFERDFSRIIDQFVDEYFEGRTPNPCVLCNIWLKFGKLWSYGKQVGADFVATGHYARIARASDGTFRVARAQDRAKDQSYVLFGLETALLQSILFPVGEFPKSEIRRIAKAHDLSVHDKSDSQEICFVPSNDYRAFVRARRPEMDTTGDMVDEKGTLLGHHAGIEAFTIGQRRGLGITLGEPRYVVQIEPERRTVTIGPRESLEKRGLEAARFRWQGPVPEAPARCLAQIRAQQKPVSATVEALPGERAQVVFDSPVSAVSPGQVVTVYQDELVLGGGWIERALS